MKRKTILLAATVAWLCSATVLPCASAAEHESADGSMDATRATEEVNQKAATAAAAYQGDEHANAAANLVGAAEEPVIAKKGAKDGDAPVWDVKAYDFLKGKAAPATANPSLWQNAQLNAEAGVFKVWPTDPQNKKGDIYQVRGYDMANTTFIRSAHGWIVFDTLMCTENMQAAYALMKKEVFPDFAVYGNRIVAVLYSHPHVDHFGGIRGLLPSENDVYQPGTNIRKQDDQIADAIKQKKTLIMAPEGFLEEAISENVYAGKAMGRRAQYQYGVGVPRSDKGALSIGIGLGQSTGEVSLIAPTYTITPDTKSATIDGVKMEFQLTPDTEAPSEVNVWFPKWRALWLAENCTATMHNIYTLRGAKVRDANAWAKYICEAIGRYGQDVDVVFQSHNWPHWKNADIKDYMENTAATYKYIHDQTLHYINLGYTSTEISHMLKLPGDLDRYWYNRPYYGTVSHNAKAVYQKYMGWYDANPVDLNPLTPEDTAKKLVEYLGSTERVMALATLDYVKGHYQWVAQITKELIYADPTNIEARKLCAAALEQLGYQAESGTWRNAYLKGAMELRQPPQTEPEPVPAPRPASASSLGTSEQMTAEMALDYLGIITDASKAVTHDVSLRLKIRDEAGKTEAFDVTRKNGVVLYYEQPVLNNIGVKTISCTRKQFVDAVLTGNTEEIAKVNGDSVSCLDDLLNYCDAGSGKFNIIEPHPHMSE